MSALSIRGAVKRYGAITAVDHLDLEVPEGTCVGLLGPNGAGKSTTMRLLTAQAIADEGEIQVLGHSLPGDSKAARAAGFNTRRTGTSVSVLGVERANGHAPEGERRPANLEDLFVLLTGEEAL